MPRLARLRKRPDFQKVAASGMKWVAPGFILQARRRAQGRAAAAPDGIAGFDDGNLDDEAALVRLGFTVSRKVGGAVARNRARRRLRAAAAEVVAKAGRPGYDYVLIGRKGTLTCPYGDLLADLRRGLERLGAPRERRHREKEKR